MGTVKVDMASKGKRVEDAYPLDSIRGVYAVLSQFHRIRETRFIRGDYDAALLLLDFYQSIQEANLTDRQREVIYNVFVLDLTQQEVAKILAISQQAVSEHVNSVVQKVATNNKAKEAKDIA